MKKILLCFIYLSFIPLINTSAQPQVADVIREIIVEDLAGGVKTLKFGLDTTATDEIDAHLGESDLPPFPPAGAFEARFFLPQNNFQGTLSSYDDYRQALLPLFGTREHRLAYQVGTGTVIRITWNFASDITGVLQDIITGTLINQVMVGSGSYTVTNPGAFNRLKMVISYNGTVPVELTSFNALVSGKTITLNWQTSSEVNNSGFEVQRKSSNSDWEKLAFINGAGTTSEQKSYSYVDNNVTGNLYTYRLKQIDFNGNFKYSNEVEVDLTVRDYKLLQNYPNPFNPSTTISFSIPVESFITVKIYDMVGQEVATLFSGESEAGIYTLNWSGTDKFGSQLSSGSYICKMTAGNFSESMKMIFLK